MPAVLTECVLRSIRFALTIAKGIVDLAQRSYRQAELTKQLEIAETWDAFEQSRSGEDFDTWCTQHGAPASITNRL